MQFSSVFTRCMFWSTDSSASLGTVTEVTMFSHPPSSVPFEVPTRQHYRELNCQSSQPFTKWKRTILGRFRECNDFRWVFFVFVLQAFVRRASTITLLSPLIWSSFSFQTYGFSGVNVEWEVYMISPQCKVLSNLRSDCLCRKKSPTESFFPN